jgi:AcrR family transcriptional regulator
VRAGVLARCALAQACALAHPGVEARSRRELPFQGSEDRFTPVKARSIARRPDMRTRAREAAATVILEAAEEVAAARGLEATSTAAIAERAGVAVGTLYNYFPDREALLEALFKLRRDALLPRLVAAAEATAALPFEERLRAYLAGVARSFDEFRPFCRVAMAVAEGGGKPRPRSAVLLAITETLTEILRPVLRGRAEEHARMLFGAFKAQLHWRIERDEPFEPAAELLVEVFLPGIRQRRGAP